MKKVFIPGILLQCFVINITAQAQTEANPIIVVTWEYERPNLQKDDTTFKNFNYDSLISWYVDKGIRPNHLIKNFRVLNHYWGDDSRKTIFIYEVDGFANINKSEAKTPELIDASFKNETEKKLFWRRWSLIFDHHTDTIMLDGAKPKL